MFRRLIAVLSLCVLMLSSLPTFAQQPISPAVPQQPTIAGDQNWDDRFGLEFGHGGYSFISAMVEFRGELYVAGQFTVRQQGYKLDTNIVRWNGRRWAAVGSTNWNGGISAMTVRDDQLYVAGTFSTAGGVPANNVARWDGHQWYALGNGINGYARAIEWYNGELYLAGSFTLAGSLTVSNIARWNGSTWNDVAGGVQGLGYTTVFALKAKNDGLYVGGTFNQAGTVEATNIARWDGTTWSTLGTGLEGDIYTIAEYKNQLYVGGTISTTNGYQGIMRFVDNQWQPLASSPLTQVWSLSPINDSLYIGADYRKYNQTFQPKVYRWDDTSFSQVGPAFTGTAYYPIGQRLITGIYQYQQKLYVAGDISFLTDSMTASNILMLENGNWRGLGEGILLPGYDPRLASLGSGVTIANRSNTQIGSLINSRATFSGSMWIPEDFGSAQGTKSLAYDGTTAYASNDTRVYQRVGTQWQAITGTFNNTIQHIAAVNGQLYVVGKFTAVDGLAVNQIARWDGTQWSGVGAGIFTDAYFTDIVVRGSAIYVAGKGLQTTANGSTSTLLFWNGSQWQSLATAPIDALAVDAQGSMYAGGRFSSIGGIAANNIAQYSNGTWSALGSGITTSLVVKNPVRDIVVDGTTLYVGGEFTQAGSVAASNIARYDAGTWSALGSGTDNSVASLAVDPQHNLYVSGQFDTAGGKPSSRFAVWHPNGLPNTQPVAVNNTVDTVSNQSIAIPVLTNDYDIDDDALSITSITQPSHGTAVISGTSVLYTPAAGYSGSDTFGYTISDGRGGTSSATVTITVAANPTHSVFLPFVTR